VYMCVWGEGAALSAIRYSAVFPERWARLKSQMLVMFYIPLMKQDAKKAAVITSEWSSFH
jgi:hypothetical protein